MPDPREKDHWRELADLLGLPPDENQSVPAPPPTRPPPPPHHEKWDPEPREREWHLPEAEPVAEDSFGPTGDEEREISAGRMQAAPPSQIPEPEPTHSGPAGREVAEFERAGPGPGVVDESSRDRPRRGRRRGRRGERDHGSERDERASRERTPRTEESLAPLEQSRGDDNAGPAPGEEPEEVGGGWAGRDRHHKHAESAQSDAVPDAMEEEILDTEDVERPEPPPEEEDDEEIDKLTDWNVPSWTELIGSLYRPER